MLLGDSGRACAAILHSASEIDIYGLPSNHYIKRIQFRSVNTGFYLFFTVDGGGVSRMRKRLGKPLIQLRTNRSNSSRTRPRKLIARSIPGASCGILAGVATQGVLDFGRYFDQFPNRFHRLYALAHGNEKSFRFYAGSRGFKSARPRAGPCYQQKCPLTRFRAYRRALENYRWPEGLARTQVNV